MALSGGGHPARTARSGGREGRIHPRRIGVQRSRRTTFMARSPAWMITKKTPEAALAFRRMCRSTMAHWRLHHCRRVLATTSGTYAATALDTGIRPGASASGWGTATSKNSTGCPAFLGSTGHNHPAQRPRTTPVEHPPVPGSPGPAGAPGRLEPATMSVQVTST